MDIILWRHAEAEDSPLGGSDAARALTRRGNKQAEKMAAWLRDRLPDDRRILASPAVRTQQTVAALKLAFTTAKALAVGTTPDLALAEAGWPRAGGTVILVGHQPTLGRIAAGLLFNQDSDWSIRKGAIVWISGRSDGRGCVLRAALTPDLL